MTSFCVFGITDQVAKSKADKKVKTTGPGGVMKPQHEYEQELASTAATMFATMKPLQISPAFDAPQFAADWAAIAARTVKCRDLGIMVRAQKTDKSDNIVKNKRTGLPCMTWKPYPTALQKVAA